MKKPAEAGSNGRARILALGKRSFCPWKLNLPSCAQMFLDLDDLVLGSRTVGGLPLANVHAADQRVSLGERRDIVVDSMQERSIPMTPKAPRIAVAFAMAAASVPAKMSRIACSHCTPATKSMLKLPVSNEPFTLTVTFALSP
jgi:hypothetical protein